MDGRTRVALVAGVIPLVAVVWAFFEQLLPFATPDIAHPWRASIPFLVVFATSLVLGFGFDGADPRIGLVIASPAAVLGGILGVFAALGIQDLFVVGLLVVLFLVLGAAGTWFGSQADPTAR